MYQVPFSTPLPSAQTFLLLHLTLQVEMHAGIALRGVVLYLKAADEMTNAEISALTGVSPRTVRNIYSKAIERGFNPHSRPLVIEDSYVVDASRSGRPRKQDSEAQPEVQPETQDEEPVL